jgi:hypothetical protein
MRSSTRSLLGPASCLVQADRPGPPHRPVPSVRGAARGLMIVIVCGALIQAQGMSVLRRAGSLDAIGCRLALCLEKTRWEVCPLTRYPVESVEDSILFAGEFKCMLCSVHFLWHNSLVNHEEKTHGFQEYCSSRLRACVLEALMHMNARLDSLQCVTDLADSSCT